MSQLPALKTGTEARVTPPAKKWSFEEHAGSPVSEAELCLHGVGNIPGQLARELPEAGVCSLTLATLSPSELGRGLRPPPVVPEPLWSLESCGPLWKCAYKHAHQTLYVLFHSLGRGEGKGHSFYR